MRIQSILNAIVSTLKVARNTVTWLAEDKNRFEVKKGFVLLRKSLMIVVDFYDYHADLLTAISRASVRVFHAADTAAKEIAEILKQSPVAEAKLNEDLQEAFKEAFPTPAAKVKKTGQSPNARLRASARKGAKVSSANRKAAKTAAPAGTAPAPVEPAPAPDPVPVAPAPVVPVTPTPATPAPVDAPDETLASDFSEIL